MVNSRSRALRYAAVAALALAAQQAGAACTFGSSGEPSLQASVDTLLGTGVINTATGCLADGNDVAWTTLGNIGEIDIVLELAGNAATNSFGIYDLSDPSRRLTVFTGSDGVDSTATLRLSAAAGGGWNVRVRGDDSPVWSAPLKISTSAFGFYLNTLSQGTFFSGTGLNTDGVDHMYAYQGNNTGNWNGDVFDVNSYLLAWEDLAGGGDRDYQDFVAIVQDIRPVPLPTALWLLASGLIGLTGVARRRG
ncbi:MAG TPA: DUF4114 domain-containing protein [Povalibacter sp.]|nr:DUF4114 domain-containing protein [Povalibacter sp.]